MVKFAQLGKTGIYAPVQATIGTKVGTVTIRARRFESLALTERARRVRSIAIRVNGARNTDRLFGGRHVGAARAAHRRVGRRAAVPAVGDHLRHRHLRRSGGAACFAAAERVEKIPWQVWLVGIAGLFGYHFFYFTALRNAPAVEASLIAYLWPLLIVLGSALMPGERLRWNHVAGALLGLAGTVLIVTRGGGVSFDGRYMFGYAMAGACASSGRPIRCCRGAFPKCRPASSPGSALRLRRCRSPVISRWKKPCCRRAPANGLRCSASA